MNRLDFSDVSAILAMRDQGASAGPNDEQLVIKVAELLPHLPKRNGSSVSITRDAVSLSYCLLYSVSEEVRAMSRSALLYLVRTDDYWPDTNEDGQGTLDDQLVLAIAVQEIRRCFGISSAYAGPLIDPSMAERIEQRVSQLSSSPVADTVLLGGARSRIMELELSNIGRLAERLKLNIAEVVAVARDVIASQESREFARGALAYLLEKDDEIPDHLGVIGLIDDNYAMIHALDKSGSVAARMSRKLDSVVSRWPWMLNIVIDDGRFCDSPPDWILLTISSLQQLSIMGGEQRMAGLMIPKAGCLPVLMGFFGALALVERGALAQEQCEAPAVTGEVRAVDRILWTRTPCRPSSLAGRVIVIGDHSSYAKALSVVNIHGENLAQVLPVAQAGLDGSTAPLDSKWPDLEPVLIVAASAYEALGIIESNPVLDCVIVDASHCLDLSAESLEALEGRADVLVMCEHRDLRTAALLRDRGVVIDRAGRAELSQIKTRGRTEETAASPILELQRRTLEFLRKKIVPHVIRCPKAIALADAVQKLREAAERSEESKPAMASILPEIQTLSSGLMRFPGILPRDHGIEVRLAGLDQALAEADEESRIEPEVARSLGHALEALYGFADMLYGSNEKYSALVSILEKHGRVSLLVSETFFRELLNGMKLKGGLSDALDLLAPGEEVQGTALEHCPQVLSGWHGPELMRQYLEPPKAALVHLLFYPHEFECFRARERAIVQVCRQTPTRRLSIS